MGQGVSVVRRLTLAPGLLVSLCRLMPGHNLMPGHRATTSVDLIEINHYVSHGGQLNQVIFWSRDPDGEYHVRAWRLRSKVVVARASSSMVVTQSEQGRNSQKVVTTHNDSQRVVIIWSKRGRVHRVTSPRWIETWTLYDPEVLDRRVLPKEQREGM